MTEAVKLTQELVKIESTNPGKREWEMAEYIQAYLGGCGARVHLDEVMDGRCNVVAELAAGEHAMAEGRPASALVLMGHMDTVVLDEGWSVNPLEGEIRDGKIYGRGACDMKSGLACALSVFRKTSLRVKNGEITLKHPLKLICTVDEECNMRGAERAIIARDVSEHDWVIDLEPTEGQIQMAHKGRFWMEMTVQGITAHASRPELGADAIAAAGEIISRVRRAFQKLPVHEELGRSTVTFGQITGGYQPYVVPDQCKIWLDMRLAPPMSDRAVLRIVDCIIAETEKGLPGIHTTYKITGNRPYIERNDQSVLMKELKEACRDVMGKEPEVGPFSGYTDTAVIAGILQNRECMSYGPGSLNQAHKPDEYVEIADIRRCESVFAQLVQRIVIEER